MIKPTVDGRQYRITERRGRTPTPADIKRDRRIYTNLNSYEEKLLMQHVEDSGMSLQQFCQLALSMYTIDCYKQLVKS